VAHGSWDLIKLWSPIFRSTTQILIERRGNLLLIWTIRDETGDKDRSWGGGGTDRGARRRRYRSSTEQRG
jgi:hypothetical protein